MKVLVVEDEAEIRNYIQKSLEAECFVVDTAEDGAKGSQMAQTKDYDLIVLDNIMPKKNGLDVCEDIRRDGKDTPILVLSVKSEITTKVDLLNAGADDYLTKPFSVDELLARIKALLRRPKEIKDEKHTIGNLEIDIAGQKVRRAGKEIDLTRKEFKILDFLVRNQGVTISRSMLMEHVWDMSVDPFSNTIESHILSLQKKIDTDGEKKLIHTVPGRGYKIELA